MNYGELMVGGLKLMVFGMGMVYVFMVVMIGAMKVMEVVLRPLASFLEPPKTAAAPKKKPLLVMSIALSFRFNWFT